MALRRPAASRLPGSMSSTSWIFCSARGNSSPIEPLQGLASQRLLQCFGVFLGCREAVPGIFGHRLVNDLADQLAYQRIQIADGGRDMVANGLGRFHLRLASEWLTASQGFVEIGR